MSSTIKLINSLNKPATELLERGIKLIGPTSGAFLGAITNDLNAIVLGAAIGDVISDNANDFSQRFLSEKEKDNISLTEIFSIAKIVENQKEGHQISHELFETNKSGNAYELYNGILVTAKNNYEDKKLEILGRFYGNSIFQKDLEPHLIHFLLSTLQSLNFKQICILALVGQHEKYFTSLTELEELKKRDNWYELFLIQNELSNMILNGLLIPHNDAMLTHINSRHLNKTRLSTVGEMLYTICELQIIDEEDLDDIINFFK